MASRKDYASNKRGKAAASRAKPAPRKKAPPKKRFPTGLLALTLLLMVGLGYGLYNLTQVDPEQPSTPLANSKPSNKSNNKPAAKKPEPKKPASPAAQTAEKTKHFDFYNMLENSEVSTQNIDAYKSTPRNAKTEHTYLLQAGSFKIKADAERMRAQLILTGLPNVHTSESTSSDGTVWYRVRLGPFENRSRLSKAYDKLVQQDIQPLRIKQ